jgi:BASS family bile acid:Na+ symporter
MQKVKAFGDWLTKWFTAIVIVWAVFNYFVPQASLWGKSYTGYSWVSCCSAWVLP